jgi:hypothetical protein
MPVMEISSTPLQPGRKIRDVSKSKMALDMWFMGQKIFISDFTLKIDMIMYFGLINQQIPWQMVSKKNIQDFLEPKKLAIAGVSRNPKKFGHAVFRELKKSGYSVYPINPNTDTLDGEKCYAASTTLLLSDPPLPSYPCPFFRRQGF